MATAANLHSNDIPADVFMQPVDPFLHSNRADYVEIAPNVFRVAKVEQPAVDDADCDAFWAGFEL